MTDLQEELRRITGIADARDVRDPLARMCTRLLRDDRRSGPRAPTNGEQADAVLRELRDGDEATHQAIWLFNNLVKTRSAVLADYQATHPQADVLRSVQIEALGFLRPPPVRAGAHPIASPGRYPLLGRSIGLPVGVPATQNTAQADWISYYAETGFNVITTRSLRSRHEPGFPEPHFVYVRDVPADLRKIPTVRAIRDPQVLEAEGIQHTSAANSYGIPCDDPSEWQAMLRLARRQLGPAQLLIASVVGSAEAGSVRDDFVNVASMAASTGVAAVELNLSFPTTPPVQGRRDNLPAYDPDLCVQIVRAVGHALAQSSVRVVAKLPYLSRRHLIRLARSIAPYVDGISGINAMPVRVVDDDGNDVFAGRLPRISGAVLLPYAREFVSTLASVRNDTLRYFEIIAAGGVMSAADVLELRHLGADAVQSAVGALTNPAFIADVYEAEADGSFLPRPGSTDAYVASVRRNLGKLGKVKSPYVRREFVELALSHES